MMCRPMNSHRYTPATYPQVTYDGAVRVEYVKNVPTVWAVSRPMSYPVDPNQGMSTGLARGGTHMFRMQLTAPNVEMDPSNPATWQRQYIFQ